MKAKINTTMCDCNRCQHEPICAVIVDMRNAKEALDKSFRHQELPIEIQATCTHYNTKPEFEEDYEF